MNEWERRILTEMNLAPKNFSVHDLRELCRHNPIVNAHWSLWVSGQSGSFEQMLIHLAIHLANQNKQLADELMKASRMDIKPIVITPQAAT